MATDPTTPSTMDTAGEPDTARRCPVCLTALPAGYRGRYCSPPCKTEAWRRVHGRTRPDATPRKPPATPPPPTLRDCPHCGEPVAVVTLLATAAAARPDTPHNIR
jgi:hypothetical protein